MPKASAAAPDERQTPRVGRPALSPEVIDARVAAYCARYQVVAIDDLPPFPAGQRETRQHREWLGLYKARHRQAKRTARAAEGHGSSGAACAVCGRPLAPGEAEAYVQPGERRARMLHRGCSALARAAEAAGPHAVAGLARFFRRDRTR